MKIANITKTASGQPRESAPVRGNLKAAGLRFAIVVSEFNSFITDRLLAGALDAFSEAGAAENQIEIVRVPGSFEIPVAARKLASSGRFDALICIGCILRGETPHFEYVATESSRGIQLAQLDTGVPMSFCVLTCNSLEQAMERAGVKDANKGYEAALGAIEMALLFRKLSKNSAAPGRAPRAPRASRSRTRPRSRRR
ncbi:MAG: 6,7-dimethyl-8-ribityllumazine synthase [Candidatus Acidiferrales bacterium]